MKRILSSLIIAAATVAAVADTIAVRQFRHVGPIPVVKPVQIDSTDVNAKPYDVAALLESRLNLNMVSQGEEWSSEALPKEDKQALHLLGFALNTSNYSTLELKLEKAPKKYKLYVDGKDSHAGAQKFTPGSHEVVVKYLSQTDADDSLRIVLVTDSTMASATTGLTLTDIAANTGKLCTIEQQVNSRRYSQIGISADGKWITTAYYKRNLNGGNDWTYELTERLTGARRQLQRNVSWMPRSNRYYYTQQTEKGRAIIVVDPATQASEVLAEGIPEGSFFFVPTEDRLIFTLSQEGPKELNPDAFEFVHPDDRQPGWRNRSTLALYDIRSGLLQPLTFGYNSHWATDVTQDGKKLLFCKNESNLTSRPTTVTSLYQMDLETLEVDTLVVRDGFLASYAYSPDGKTVAITASPEAFGGVGNTVPEGMTPSMFDYHLYLLDVASREVKAVGKDFNPTVTSLDWSPSDNRIYMKAENRDSCSIFVFDPKTSRFDMIAQPEEVVDQLAVASASGVILTAGESHNHSWRLYTIEKTRKQPKVTMLQDLNADVYEGVEVCECKPWSFTNSNGDEVSCRYYLPNGFSEQDASSEKFPMIVYYYGGCSGTLRNFEYTYPWTIWAANGYAVLVVNPSGATGFGQEWAARHVNTAGTDPARDIIEATKTFCQQHEWVNAERLGCIGASYGGFMTQYLQTVTDIFRCAVSHAGISDHTTYWGYGYWGYSYSEVSMANSYPWNRKDLYVENSPIYNVDKVKSSMLFLHGTADTNVPYNNSVQMFTALKLLGKDVAMVSIQGENHGIRDPKKRILWHNATMAWFARCLKDDPTWWEALYPKKTL